METFPSIIQEKRNGEIYSEKQSLKKKKKEKKDKNNFL